SEGGQGGSPFRRLVHKAYGAGRTNTEVMNEGHVVAQRALDTTAALALAQLAARHATGDSALARLLRERQDLAQELEGRDKLLIAAVAQAPGQRNRDGEGRLKARIEEIGGRVRAIEPSLRPECPGDTPRSTPPP